VVKNSSEQRLPVSYLQLFLLWLRRLHFLRVVLYLPLDREGAELA